MKISANVFRFPWHQLKPLIVMKLENVIEEYIEFNPHEEVPILPNVENVRFDDMRERLLRALESFNRFVAFDFSFNSCANCRLHPFISINRVNLWTAYFI